MANNSTKTYEIYTTNNTVVQYDDITNVGYDEVAGAYIFYETDVEGNEYTTAIFPARHTVCIRLIKEASQ